MLLFVKTKVEGRGEMRELIEGASKLACKQTNKQTSKQTNKHVTWIGLFGMDGKMMLVMIITTKS